MHAANGGVQGSLTGISIGTVTPMQKVWRSTQAFGDIAFAYSYSLILIEIQDTIRAPPPSESTATRVAPCPAARCTSHAHNRRRVSAPEPPPRAISSSSSSSSRIMAHLAVVAPSPAAVPQTPAAANDLFGKTIETHPPWFRPETFLRADFNPDAYFTELRSYAPLASLAAELRSALAALCAELIGLMKRGYAD